MKCFLFTICFTIGLLTTVDADLVTFRLDTNDAAGPIGMISGNTLTVFNSDIMINGVFFNATLNAIGNGDVSHNSAGVGVGGNTLNDGESISFSVAISDVLGGTVSFGGFTELDFNAFTMSSDSASFSTGDTINGESSINLFDLTTLTGGVPQTFSITGVAASAGGTNSFSLDTITGHFTATAVPEPSALSVLWIACLLGCVRRKKSAN